MLTLKLFGRGDSFRIPEYSIVGNLIFDVVAQTPNSELSPFEKLFVVKTVNRGAHAGYMADIYLACGCFSEVRSHYLKPEHPRKLGDICWCEGDLAGAEVHYEKTSSEAQSYRNGSDDDRLIKLAFIQNQWTKVIDRFANAALSRGFSEGKVFVGQGEASAKPLLDMLAVSLTQLATPTPPRILRVIDSAFGISKTKWEEILKDATYHDLKTITKLKMRCRPRLGAMTASTVEEAKGRGDTVRARHVSKYIENADSSLEAAQRALELYLESNGEQGLEVFLALVTGSGITSICHSFLFSVTGFNLMSQVES